jgi:hypothetical protein
VGTHDAAGGAVTTDPTPCPTRSDESASLTSAQGLFDVAGVSAAREVEDAVAEQRDLSSALRRPYTRGLNYQAAALSEPLTAAALQPLADQGWRNAPATVPTPSSSSATGQQALYPGAGCVGTRGWRWLPTIPRGVLGSGSGGSSRPAATRSSTPRRGRQHLVAATRGLSRRRPRGTGRRSPPRPEGRRGWRVAAGAPCSARRRLGGICGGDCYRHRNSHAYRRDGSV